MAEIQSYPFDLIKSPLFKTKHNISFSASDFEGTNKCQVVISTVCPDNFDDCLNSNGLLNTSGNNAVTVSATGDIALEYVEQDESNSYIQIKNNVTINLNDDTDVKGVFIRRKSNNFVIFVMVNENPMRFCEKIMFEKDNVILQIIG